jgi:hypothetical protein
MFIFGRGHKTLSSPLSSEFACSACGVKGACVAVVDYDYAHIFWKFGNLKNEVVRVCCKACLASQTYDAQAQRELFARHAKSPVPFMDRYGAHVLILVLVAWFAFASMFPCVVNPGSQACLDSR